MSLAYERINLRTTKDYFNQISMASWKYNFECFSFSIILVRIRLFVLFQSQCKKRCFLKRMFVKAWWFSTEKIKKITSPERSSLTMKRPLLANAFYNYLWFTSVKKKKKRKKEIHKQRKATIDARNFHA